MKVQMTTETLHKGSHLCEVDQEARSPDVVISSISPITTYGYTVITQVNGVTSSFLVDTGSAITLIGQELWEKCKYDQDIMEPWLKQLVSVDGSPVSVLGSCQVRISIGGSTFCNTAVVVDTLTSEEILGVDILQGNKCLVDLCENTLKIPPHSISIPLLQNIKKNADSKQANVVVAQTVCVPARSELETLAEVHNNIDSEETWLLEGKQMKDSPLVVARVLVRPSNNTIVVCFLNPLSEPFTLHRNSMIAVMEPIDSLCICATDANTDAKTTVVLSKKNNLPCGIWFVTLMLTCLLLKEKICFISWYSLVIYLRGHRTLQVAHLN